jgi:plastocyanin
MPSRLTALLAASAALVGLAVLAPGASSDDQGGGSHVARGDRYVPKPAGTVEKLEFYFGPYTIPPGHDANRIDLELPVQNGFILQVEPGMRRASNFTVPSHQEAHIHHAHWFALDPGNEEDNYTGGNTEWIFGNGDEETKADFMERSRAEPGGPEYGQYVGVAAPQIMIYMLHNKTSQPLVTYIVLNVTFKHGSKKALNRIKPHRDLSGVLFGRTFTVPRNPLSRDATYEVAEDSPRGRIKWNSTLEGTIIGTGGHLHPGGLNVIVENFGSKRHPCPSDGRGYGGTRLLKSDALFRNARFSEDFQMEVTNPAWRAPLHKGDQIQISGTYENRDHGWYDVMTHEGFYIDTQQRPLGRCKPYLVGPAGKKATRWQHIHKKRVVYRRRHIHRRVHIHADGTRHIHRRVHIHKRVRIRKRRHLHTARGSLHIHRKKHIHRKRHIHRRVHIHADGTRHIHRRVHIHKRVHWHKKRHIHKLDPTAGVPNRPWGRHRDRFCGEAFGQGPCERPMAIRPPGIKTNTVTIANFRYVPGDHALSGSAGSPPRVKKGTSLTFVNADQQAGIRHTVTTCPWPCNGSYVANYPFPDGVWDSRTLGYDAIDGGTPDPVASTPPTLRTGKYAYFCRIHPWMRGAFEVTN